MHNRRGVEMIQKRRGLTRGGEKLAGVVSLTETMTTVTLKRP